MASDARSAATRFLDAHPELRAAMTASARFRELKARAGLVIDGETLYAVRGDTLGTEDDFYVDALAKGARPGAADPVYRDLFLELDERLQALVRQRVTPK